MSITVINKDTSLPPLLLPNLSNPRPYNDPYSSNSSSRSNSSSTTLSRIDSTSSSSSISSDLFLGGHINNELKKGRVESEYYYNPVFSSSSNDMNNESLRLSKVPSPQQFVMRAQLQETPPQQMPITPIEMRSGGSLSFSHFETKTFKKTKSKKALLNIASPKQKLPSPTLNHGVIQKPTTNSRRLSPFDSSFSSVTAGLRRDSSLDLTDSAGSKRQRIGPSCDKCRSKKIKCDAKIEILCQDEAILHMFSNNLHHQLSKYEIEEKLRSEIFSKSSAFAYISKDLFARIEQRSEVSQVIKHLDKIIYFEPCTSCSRKKHIGSCTFSKGFTRADINVFSKIGSRVAQKPIFEMTIKEYKKAGF
ncbi:Sterol uptake protein 1 [Nakaseomyces bracarensis]|uniref:Sterol uptake protein 1 n=1 Tax=Nakaseomyces bracarensis TaxID=273131 RepID=A0ABR4NXJ5_9SACH